MRACSFTIVPSAIGPAAPPAVPASMTMMPLGVLATVVDAAPTASLLNSAVIPKPPERVRIGIGPCEVWYWAEAGEAGGTGAAGGVGEGGTFGTPRTSSDCSWRSL